MSWHHGDYIDLLSAIGGAASAAFAAYATWLAKKSTEISRESVIETARQGRIALLTAELVRLSERANSVVDEKSLLKGGYSTLIEITTALGFAKEAIKLSTLSVIDKAEMTELFKRHIHPAIFYEVNTADELRKIDDAMQNTFLIKAYREARIFLELKSPAPIPDPS
ncbi:hypothetical protein RA290_05595 [Pantoea agglomerans]|uniref:hypothetical protein n=1 Tax=Enterobacter agglomerans TaxID=549 RepID=UPI0028E8A759|nr:hypothetical protein [uncultured Pantoea sp.]